MTSLDAVLGVFDRVDGPIVTLGDVAGTLDCSRETARPKLTELHERGYVRQRSTAGRVVWWLVDSETSVETSEAPATPLRALVGGLNDGEADRVRERSKTFCESVDDDVTETHPTARIRLAASEYPCYPTETGCETPAGETHRPMTTNKYP